MKKVECTRLPEGREAEMRQLTSSVRDLGFAGLEACGGLGDQVRLHNLATVAKNPGLDRGPLTSRSLRSHTDSDNTYDESSTDVDSTPGHCESAADGQLIWSTCAQTELLDKFTVVLAQRCPATDQVNWEMRVRQLQRETDQQPPFAKDPRQKKHKRKKAQPVDTQEREKEKRMR